MSTESPETPVWHGTPSQWKNLGVYLVCVLLAAAVIAAYFRSTLGPPVLLGLVVPALWALGRWIATRCHVYDITSERIKVTTGLLSHRTDELELYRVRDYSLVEPFWLRLVGCGDIVLVTADRTSPAVVLHAVPHAAALKDQIRANTERQRQRRGVRDLELDPPPA